MKPLSREVLDRVDGGGPEDWHCFGIEYWYWGRRRCLGIKYWD